MNPVNHFEVPADDVERAQAFYSEVFGWNINKHPEMQYWFAVTTPTDEKMMPKDKGAINGGLYERADNEGPMPVITVNNIEESIENVVTAGGEKVIGPDKVGDMGRCARMKDTEGNYIGLWQALHGGEAA